MARAVGLDVGSRTLKAVLLSGSAKALPWFQPRKPKPKWRNASPSRLSILITSAPIWPRIIGPYDPAM